MTLRFPPEDKDVSEVSNTTYLLLQAHPSPNCLKTSFFLR